LEKLPLRAGLKSAPVPFLLLAACVFLMNTQHGIPIPAGKNVIHLGLVDILIWVTFGVWVVSELTGKSRFRPKLPFAFAAIPVVSAASLLWASPAGKSAAAKEIFQLVEYFIVAPLLILNLAGSRARLRGLLSVFLLAVTLVVAWGLLDYAAGRNVLGPSPDYVAGIFNAGGAFGNVNALGVFFAIALPVAFGVALFDDIKPLARISLIVPVAAGAAITLSGAALAALLAALLLALGLRSRRILLPAGVAVVLAGIMFLPLVLRADHSAIVTNSAAVYLDDNHLLTPGQMLQRAEKLTADGRDFDAHRLLLRIWDRDALTPQGEALLEKVEQNIQGRELPGSVLPADRPVVAVRYKRWQAALKAIRTKLWGHGLGTFQKSLAYGAIPKYGYNTDEPEAFNLGIDQPDTFNRFLIAAVETGLPGLLAFIWFYIYGLSSAVGLFGSAKGGVARGVAAGATASLAFLPIVAAYSDVLVRGAALPLVFIICCVRILADEAKTE